MFICMKKVNFICNFFEILQRHYKLALLGTWKCLTNPIKTIVSICSMLSCLSASKKSTSSFIYSLQYCREIANLLFYSVCACLATHLKWQYHFEETLRFISRQKMNFIFFAVLQTYCKLVVLGSFGMPSQTNPKWYYQLVENLCLSAGKETTSSLMLFWGYWKDMQTYFGYFGYPWLHTPKIIVSTYRRLWCLSPCQKYTSSFTSFLRYYILKNPVIWLVDSILAHNSRLRILPDMGLAVKYQ